MIIGIDGNEANVNDRVGVNVYAYEILWGLYKLQDEWQDKYRVVVYLREKPLHDLPDKITRIQIHSRSAEKTVYPDRF